MRKKICILLSVILVASIGIVAVCNLLSRPNQATGSALPAAEATSIEVSSSPAPRPELQEGQYLLVHGAQTNSVTVSKNIMRFSPSAFSYDSPQDYSSHEISEKRWLISIYSQGEGNNYRITMEQLESSIELQEGNPMEIVPSQPIEFTFLLNSNGVLSREDEGQMEEFKPVSFQAYCLLQHALSGVTHANENQSWTISPFFEAGNDASTFTAQYTPTFQNNQMEVNIQYSQQLDAQYINNAMSSVGNSRIESAQIDPFFYRLALNSSDGLLLGHCQDSDVHAQASGSISINPENSFVSTTELEYSREGHLIFPWNDPDSTYTQRLDFSSQTHHRIDVTKVEEDFSDLSTSKTH